MKQSRRPTNLARRFFPIMTAMLVFASLGSSSCSCAVGRPSPDGAITIEDSGTDAPTDSGPDGDAMVAVTCGNAIIDTEDFEVCDPALPVGAAELLRCICPSDGNSCTNDIWVDDPVQGQCYGSCQHPALTGYGYTTCDDSNECTNDMIQSGTVAACDLTCTHTPRSGFGVTTCDDMNNCTNDVVVSGSPTTCDVQCGNTPRSGFGINTCDDGRACTVDVVVSGSPATCDVVCTNTPLSTTDATCDGIDDNCNNVIDEGYVPTGTTCGQGACASVGATSCVGGVIVNSCMGGTPGALDNNCNNVDDDCNGVKDDGYVPVPTSCGVGACAATGVTTCSGGAVTNSCMPGFAAGSDTSCNGIDNDCNGLVDDGYVPLTISCGVGACTASGTTSCVSGTVVNMCTPGVPAATDATCNNIDDNCDGARDEGYVTVATSCGVGACAGTGFSACMAGVVSNSCVPGYPAGSDTTCNNIDDDCNGLKDDGYVTAATACGVGACARTGATTCVAGAVVNSCMAGTPSASDATCDNVDDNCDGTKDEGYVATSTSCGVGGCAASGSTMCFGGVVLNSCTPGAPAGSDTTCNNIDDDCNGLKDEGYANQPTTCGVGACAASGMTICTAGVVGNSCMPGVASATDTTCNNIDDNCNGLVDEGWVVTTTMCGAGICSNTGGLACVNGAVSNTCVAGMSGGSDTTCNNQDDNCDGTKDEGYVPVPTSCGVGACAAMGVSSCAAGAVLSSCVAGTPAATDMTCNNIDDNCDGTKDEGYMPMPTSCGIGACARTGVTSCSGGVLANSCVPGLAAGSDTTCNNIDDDCNGLVDDGYAPVATSCGVGACGATGITSCAFGTVVNSCTPGAPAAADTTCNNIDDNCNGVKDEGYVPVGTSCGVGACSATGFTLCSAGAVVNSCSPLPPAGSDASCNNIDDDCNGVKDDGFIPLTTACGVGACARSGATSCVSGAVVNSCMAGAPAPSDASCNNIDDDCNGVKDDGYVVTATSCGVGACARAGFNTCVTGTVVNSCAAGPPAGSDTTCNNVDDDCNGSKDDGYVPSNTSCGVGACAATGVTACVTGTVTNSCSPGAASPTDTSCNNIDDNCNGTKDEGYVGSMTSCGIGACAATGMTSCGAGGVLMNSCMAGSPAGSDTTCNNIDDDCNGSKDDGYVSTVTSCGVGACVRAGATSCSMGMVANSCVAGSAAAMDTSCNNIDDDCNGVKDDGYVVTPTACGVGACASTGVSSCSAGVVSNSCMAGIPGPNDTSCDGVDNNCNGMTDEGYAATTTTCGLGACMNSGLLACISGTPTNTCVAGMAGGSDTTCNNQDDNCDGTKDEGYVSVPTACGVGACAATGVSSCALGVVQSSCMAGMPAATDTTCNNIDDDCNGVKDDGYVPMITNCGVGACAATGITACTGGVVSNSCVAGTPAATDTTCNNIDDNCNGTKDEGYVVTSTSCGVGACGRTGSNTCVAGAVVNTCVAGAPAPSDTTCNNSDDNCNGAVDEGYVVTSTSCGVGACARTGSNTCVAGAVVNSCMAGAPAPSDTSCDNLDNNCNGLVDEGYVSVATSCGVGACAATGVTSCVTGSTINSCTPGAPAANDATCNNIDDDCSGMIDEDFSGVMTSCGVGACTRSGITTCSAGGIAGNTCVPGMIAPEVCNNIDDDCNGIVDNLMPTSCMTGQLGVCNPGTTSCMTGISSCVRNTAPSAEVCDALDNDCNGTVNNGNPGGGISCTVASKLGPCASSTTSCSATDTAVQCLQTVFPSAEICVAGGGVGPGDGIDNDCDGSVDLSPSVTDNISTTCAGAGAPTISVAPGQTQNISGNVTVNGGADFFLVNFTGATGTGTAFHPKFTFTNGGGIYTMTPFTSTTCAASPACGSGNYAVIEATYAGNQNGCVSNQGNGNGPRCTDDVTRVIQYVIRVQRVAPATLNCSYYTIQITN